MIDRCARIAAKLADTLKEPAYARFSLSPHDACLIRYRDPASHERAQTPTKCADKSVVHLRTAIPIDLDAKGVIAMRLHTISVLRRRLQRKLDLPMRSCANAQPHA